MRGSQKAKAFRSISHSNSYSFTPLLSTQLRHVGTSTDGLANFWGAVVELNDQGMWSRQKAASRHHSLEAHSPSKAACPKAFFFHTFFLVLNLSYLHHCLTFSTGISFSFFLITSDRVLWVILPFRLTTCAKPPLLYSCSHICLPLSLSHASSFSILQIVGS